MSKFSNITKFTIGTYEVDIPINHLIRQLESYDKEYDLELNPDFQRGNVWTEEQQIAYLEFFFRDGRSARVIYFNIGVWGDDKNTDIPNMVCVDGLQRLTAFIRFFNNEIPVFGSYYKDYEDRPHYTLKFNINNLTYKKDVLKWYLEMNSGGTVHSKEELERVKAMIDEYK